jgi:hypothetical protein
MLYVSLNMKSSRMFSMTREKVLAAGGRAYNPSLKGLVLTIGIAICVSIAMSVILTYIETGTFRIYQTADAQQPQQGGGSSKGGGNSANQGIGQSQSSVSDDDEDDDGNSANQGIGQSQMRTSIAILS